MAAELSASVSVQWQTDDAQKFGTIYLTASGVGLDVALDALLAGLDASGEYLVTRALVVETVERDHRPRPTLEERTPEPREQVITVAPAAAPAAVVEQSAPVRPTRSSVRIAGRRG